MYLEYSRNRAAFPIKYALQINCVLSSKKGGSQLDDCLLYMENFAQKLAREEHKTIFVQ